MKYSKFPEVLGAALAFIWIVSAMPDIVATFSGSRPSNDISFTPTWLKALRDVYTLCAFLYLSRVNSGVNIYWRIISLVVVTIYLALGVVFGFELAVVIRGVLWIPVLAWASTACHINAGELKRFAYAAFKIFIPSSIIVSTILGIYGADMYYESLGVYQRNPGIMLSPSATAYLTCLIYLMLPKSMRLDRFASFFAGLLSLSGVFYAMTVLLFGRLPKIFYFFLLLFVLGVVFYIGIDGLIIFMTNLSGGIRTGDAISLTLDARLTRILGAMDNLSVIGKFPIGLNVAADLGLELFFPDNAMLAAIYAYGVIGFIGFFAILIKAYKSKKFDVFLLIIIASLFYVWFENILLAGLTGLTVNKYFWKANIN